MLNSNYFKIVNALMFFWRLYQNNLTGSTPPSLGNLMSLQELKLEKNAFSGSIPSWMAQ